MGDPYSGVVSLRKLADEHAAQLARGEKKIATLTAKFRTLLVSHISERVALEKRQCEMLLKMEAQIPHGQRTTWKYELAGSLQHAIGARYSVTGIEERLTAARAAKRDPSYWVRLQGACFTLDTTNFRKAHKSLKPKEEKEETNEEEENEQQVQEPNAPDPSGLLPCVVRQILDEPEGGNDTELAADLARKLSEQYVEIEALKAENVRLKKRLAELEAANPK